MRIWAPATAARVLELSVSRLRQLDQEGALPAIRDSIGRRLYDPDTVERFRAAREAKRAERTATATEAAR